MHSLARELKNIKTSEQINKIEERIKKRDLYYNPKDIEKILGLKGLDSKKEKNEVIVKKANIKKKQNIAETKIIEKRILPRELLKADEIFLTGTAVEITPISQIDNKKFNVGKITKKLISLFSDLVEKN